MESKKNYAGERSAMTIQNSPLACFQQQWTAMKA